MKTWSGAKSAFVYPPNGGGNGTGLIKNVLFQNLTMINVTNPITVNMCNTYSQYTVPCESAPTSFRIKNVTWDGIIVREGNGTVVSLNCLGQTGCNDMTVANVDVTDRTEVGEWTCVGVNGVDSGCSALRDSTTK